MPPPLVRPIVCPVLVGRGLHVAAVHGLIDEVGAGTGLTVLVAGEAGVGKSRLVGEALTYATTRRYRLLIGACFQADQAIPYAPILDLLRTRFANRSPSSVLVELGPSAPLLRPLISDLLPPSDEGPATARPDAPQDKLGLVSALARFVFREADQGPTLLVVEDLHWADASSLDLLYHLARRAREHPLMLLLTYRADEEALALHYWLARLDHDRLAQQILLSPLTQQEVGEMLRAILSDRPAPQDGFAAQIHALTDGNPFFVEEVLGALASTGLPPDRSDAPKLSSPEAFPIPRSVEAAVRQRADGLSATATELLRLAAVAGRRFDLALLSELLRRDGLALFAAVRELIAAQLVVEDRGGQLAFRHALTREAVYADLLAVEREARHKQVAEAIERTYDGSLDQHIGDLAHHWYRARQWQRALSASARAGERALSLYAPREAIEHLSHALEAADRLGMVPPADVYRGRGRAFEWIGEFDTARQDYEAALARARAASQPEVECQVLLDLGLLWAEADHARSRDYYRQALAAARDMGSSEAIAHCMNRLGNWHVNADEPAEGLRLHQNALAIFKASGDRAGMAETLDLLGMATCLGGDLPRSAEYYRLAIGHFEELDDRRGLVSSLATLTLFGGTPHTVTVALPMGPAEATSAGERAAQIACEIGWRTGEAYAEALLGACLGNRGEYDRALPLLHDALGLAQEAAHRSWTAVAHSMLGMLYLDILALPRARWHLEQAFALAQSIGFRYRYRSVVGYLTDLYVAAGELTLADALLTEALDPDAPTDTLALRLLWLARAELSLSVGQPGVALSIADRLVAASARAELACEPDIPRLTKLRGEALAALGRAGEAEVALQVARAQALARGARPLVWRICLDLGRLYLGQARSSDAGRAFAEARAIVDEIAPGIPDTSLRDTFLGQVATRLPKAQPRSPRRAARDTFDGLTAREREVATLIAMGKTNQQIADHLVVSKRTVETHIGSILSKLGYASRTRVAVWAADRGLVSQGQ